MNIQEIRLECLKESLKRRSDVFHEVEKVIEDARKMAEFVLSEPRVTRESFGPIGGYGALGPVPDSLKSSDQRRRSVDSAD